MSFKSYNVLDGNEAFKRFKVAGDGTNDNPFVPIMRLEVTPDVTSVTGWSDPLSDDNVASEKIIKETIDDQELTAVSFDSNTGIMTFEKEKGDLSVNIAAGQNKFVQSATFDTNNGVLTFTYNDLTTTTVDLDGRYIEDLNAYSVTALNDVSDAGSGQIITPTERTKLTGIEDNANNYTLPVAGASLGGILSGTDITIDGSGNVTVVDDSHNHIISNIDGLQSELDNKKDDFTENTAFNKNFGTTSGTVAEGNDSRILDSFQKSTDTLDNITAGTTNVHFTATDETKLDGIEPGATTDQTASEIKTEYESNADTNAFTDAEKTKLTGIEAGAEVNVKSDWDATTGDAQILNKPTDITDLSTHSVTELNDVTNAGSGAIITVGERDKLTQITVTQPVDLDTMESDIATNNLKVTNATHTGEVTGSGALTISNDVVDNLKLTNMATGTVKGRVSAGTGDPEDIDIDTDLKSALNLTNADVGLSNVQNVDQTNADNITSGTLASARYNDPTQSFTQDAGQSITSLDTIQSLTTGANSYIARTLGSDYVGTVTTAYNLLFPTSVLANTTVYSYDNTLGEFTFLKAGAYKVNYSIIGEQVNYGREVVWRILLQTGTTAFTSDYGEGYGFTRRDNKGHLCNITNSAIISVSANDKMRLRLNVAKDTDTFGDTLTGLTLKANSIINIQYLG